MPDENIAEQGAEGAADAGGDDFDDGFNEATGGLAKADKPDAAPKPEESTPPAKSEAGAGGADGSVGDQPPPAAAETAMQRLEKRAAAGVAGGEQPQAATPPAPKEAPPVVPSAPAAKPVTSSVLSELLAMPDVGEAIIEVDGKKTTLKEFAAEYPEVVQAGAILARSAQASGQREIAAIKDSMKADFEALQRRVENQEFWGGVLGAHPDAKTVAGSKEFVDWVGKQSRMVQALYRSIDPVDGVAVLDAYKETLAKTGKETAEAAARAKKAKLDGLQSETLRDRRVAESGEKPKADDFDAAFDEAANAKK